MVQLLSFLASGPDTCALGRLLQNGNAWGSNEFKYKFVIFFFE